MKSLRLFPYVIVMAATAIASYYINAKKTTPKITQETYEKLQCTPFVIVGGGVAGLTAANYLALGGYQPLVLHTTTPQEGGLITQSHHVQNWPGEVEITGSALIKKMQNQATHNGAIIKNESVVRVNFKKYPFVITTQTTDGEEKEYHALSCLIMMGATPNYLGIPGEQEAWGKGVSNCALCDGPLYKDKRVAVVGGGDSAVTEVLYLSNLASHVDLFVRKKKLKTNRAHLLVDLDNVNIHYETEVSRVVENNGNVSAVEITKAGHKETIELSALFLAIGSRPNSSIFKGQIALGNSGHIMAKALIPGVFAAGDIVDDTYRQAITAAGDACKAALDADTFVKSLGLNLAPHATPTKKAAVVKEEPKPIVKTHEPVTLKSSADIKALAKKGVPYMVDFYADWCGACIVMKPVLERVEKELEGKMDFYQVNVDHAEELSTEFNIRGIPAFIFFDAHGKEIKRIIGSRPYKAFLDECKELVK